jgi:hypothetical protein
MIGLILELGCPAHGKGQGHPFDSGLHRDMLHSSIYFIIFNTILPEALRLQGSACDLKACFCLGSVVSSSLFFANGVPTLIVNVQCRPRSYTSRSLSLSQSARSGGRAHELAWKQL